MGQKLVIGPINKGLKLDREPFFIDNDSFPTLINAYQWRGRVKRKRGTTFLCRLTNYFDSTNLSYNPNNYSLTLTPISGIGHLVLAFGLPSNSQIQPTSLILFSSTSGNTYTDDGKGNIVIGATVYGTISYAFGSIILVGEAGNILTAKFNYYPLLPIMGLEQVILPALTFPGNLGFDTIYSYNIVPSAPPTTSYNVSYFKNLNGTPRTPSAQANWNGRDYQQFWTLNYESALFATNGIHLPFDGANIGMQFLKINSVTGAGSTATIVVAGTNTLVLNDFVFINEVPNTVQNINFQSGRVTSSIGNTIIVTFVNGNVIGNSPNPGGIVQVLSSAAQNLTLDCIRWYDGDPTNNGILPGSPNSLGWVNFCPPLSQMLYSIGGLPPDQYYLVGGRILQSYKDRLCVIGPVVQSSSRGPFYLQDTIVYSQNGTPYYTCSFTPASTADQGFTTLATNPIYCPANQIALASAWFADLPGFGGNITLGIDQKINTSSTNEDVLILGCDTKQVRMVYSGSDVQPFNFYIINAELGSSSTFSVINMDQAVMTRGSRGLTLASQTEVQRFDLDIPDSVFQLSLTNNGTERITAQRDFQNEWVYFSYPTGTNMYIFNDQTLFYNYRDHSWGLFNESYTTYGIFQSNTQLSWSSYTLPWSAYTDSWSSGIGFAGNPQLIGGNTEGFVLIKDDGTGEATSLTITTISGSTITSPNHTLNNGDFVIFSNFTDNFAQFLNGQMYQVQSATTNTFVIAPNIPVNSYAYLSIGLITRCYIPQIQTKQFPIAWEMGRKTRIGPQQYLFTATVVSQISLFIYLSTNSSSAYNTGTIVPDPDSINNSLVYSAVLYTCPESTNLGLTPANINLIMVTAMAQQQIWHRMNTSLIGDVVQIGFTVSPSQMTMLYPTLTTAPITSVTLTLVNGVNFVQLGCVAILPANSLIQIIGVLGMIQLNSVWPVLSSNGTIVTIYCDATAFSSYISGGTVTEVQYQNHIAEVELHSAVIDISPSQSLA